MDPLTREALLACDYFLAYQEGLKDIARKTTANKVRSKELNALYERLAKQVEKLQELRRVSAEQN